MNKRSLGTVKEDLAAKYLESRGLKIKERNFRNRYGEIDLIATDGDFLVFVEVKYIKNASAGLPEEAVSFMKARTISKVADYYRVVKKIPEDKKVRFDVVAIEGEQIRWHKDAFAYSV